MSTTQRTTFELALPGDAEAGGQIAAERIAAVIRSHPEAVVGVATGSSPQPVYRALVVLVADGLDVSRVTWFALDEYVGLPAGHPESYREVLRRELAPLGIDDERLRTPDASHGDPHEAAAAYEREIIAAGGIDVQLVGIGANGHIGFNEPGTPLDAPTHVGTLAERTRLDNARFFGGRDEVPTHCITQGVGTIYRARRIVLVASGSSKALAVREALCGPVSEECPASILQWHPDVTAVLDPAAAALLVAPSPVHPEFTSGVPDNPLYLRVCGQTCGCGG